MNGLFHGPASGFGRRVLDIDYGGYAEGEAALGWLNAEVRLLCQTGAGDWTAFGARFMGALSRAFSECHAAVGHVKILLLGDGHRVGNLVAAGAAASWRGELAPSTAARMVVNARVEMLPIELEAVVRRSVSATVGTDNTAVIGELCSLQPGRPKPTYRFEHVV